MSNFGNRTECFRCGLGKDEKPPEKGPSAVDEYRDQIAAMFAQHEEELKQQQQESNDENLEAGQNEEAFSFEAYEAVDEFLDVFIDEVIKIVDPPEEKEEEEINVSEDISPVDTSLHLELPESELDQEASVEEAQNGDSTIIKTSELDQEVLAEEAQKDDSTIIETPEESLQDANNEAGDDSAAVKTTETFETVPEVNERDNSDDDYAPDSPGYIAPMEIEDAKPDLAALHASEASHQDGDDLDLHQENVDVTYECKLCTFQSKAEVFDVFLHLEENHDKNDSTEEELRSLVRIITHEKLPDPQPPNPEPIESSSVDVTASKDATEEDVTMEDMTSGNTSEDTERSTSPNITTVNTVEKLKEMLAMDGSVKFIVTPELQYTEEYKVFMAEYNKDTEDEN